MTLLLQMTLYYVQHDADVVRTVPDGMSQKRPIFQNQVSVRLSQIKRKKIPTHKE